MVMSDDDLPYNDPNRWCDRCGDWIEATPIPHDGRVFCSPTCVTEYRAAVLREEVEQP